MVLQGFQVGRHCGAGGGAGGIHNVFKSGSHFSLPAGYLLINKRLVIFILGKGIPF